MQRSDRGPWPRAAAAALVALAAAAGPAQASPGALTSAAELAAIRAAADAGTSPHAEWRDRLLEDARRSWRWGTVSGKFVTTGLTSKTCHPETDPGAGDYLVAGAPDAYAQALGAHLAGDSALARAARAHVLDLVDTTGFHGLDGDYSGGNQCVLDLAVSAALWIETARLLEDTSVWSAADTAAFQRWTAQQVYPLVAWASRARRNNWGAAGSLAAWTIAHYVDGAVSALEEVAPALRTLSPATAAGEHLTMQRRRIGRAWVGDARCKALGIQTHGGIPEELRRGTTGCDGTYLVDDDASLTYQTMHVELLVMHAEALSRRGDASLYQLEAAPGVPAILQSIRFVIANRSSGGRSWPWPSSRWSALLTAAAFHDDAAVDTAAAGGSTFRGGRILPYARLTLLAPRDGTAASPAAEPLGTPGKPELVDG